MRELVFNIVVNCVGRFCAARDVVLGRIRLGGGGIIEAGGVTRHAIQSGRNRLDAVLITPEEGQVRASVLICHGIGETVQHWLGVQRLLAANGIVSLVFDYSGYGRSTGFFTPGQSEADAVAAFHFLQERSNSLPVTVLGFSLGSGIAAAILPRVEANGLILCSSFTSLREAARSIGIPKALGFGVPPIWRTREALRSSRVPVLIVHGERDWLFPTRMAMELGAACASPAEVVLVANVAHNEPFRRPQIAYWGHVIEHCPARATGR